jgi:cytidine deaminase
MALRRSANPAGMVLMDEAELIAEAWRVRERAYAPYSGFAVGAALEDLEGRIFVGANVENRSLGLTVCAERVAVATGVIGGLGGIVRIAVVAETAEPISPCGACRQFLAEFGDPEVVLANRERVCRFQLSELLPRSREGILDG